MATDILVVTDRLILRAFRPSDLPSLVELDSDPEVMRYLTGGAPTPAAFVEGEVLPRFLTHDVEEPAFGWWAAVESSSGEFVGWFGFNRRERTRDQVVLGYRLRRAAWGKGLATEGVRALIGKAFGELGAQRVFASTYEHNVASRRVAEKAGMRLVRRFRLTAADLATSATYDGVSSAVWDGDEVEYAADRADWLGSQESS